MTYPVRLELYDQFDPNEAEHLRDQGVDMNDWDFALFIRGAQLDDVAEDITLNRLFVSCAESRWALVTMVDGRSGVLGVGR